MPLVNNKVGDDGSSGAEKPRADEKVLVESLMKVVACFRHLASCVGGCTDTLQLRDELRQTREKAQQLAVSCCQHLTSRLRDKNLPVEERKETELLWVAFSSSLELLHGDMCKVFDMANTFRLANALVQNGMQGGCSEVAVRALSLPELPQSPAPPEGLEIQESSALEEEIRRIDLMITDMELKVNVLRWTVEPRGGLAHRGDPLSSTDSVSLALFSVDEEGGARGGGDARSQMFAGLLLCGVVCVAAALSICIVIFS